MSRRLTGWLVYTGEGAERNREFIGFWMREAEKRDLLLTLKYACDALTPPFPDFAVVRTMMPSLSRRLEDAGVAVFNPAVVSEACNDKWKTYCLASELGVPYPKTEWVPHPETFASDTFPYVLKSCCGHGGSEVFLVQNSEEAKKASDRLRGVPCVAQEVVSDIGKDLRVYVLGGKILKAMLRVSETDFRSNFCLGGNAVPYTLTEREESVVKAFSDALPFGLVGVDFLFHHGQTVFNEIEDVVGCRMLYAKTNIRPVELYLDWILDQMKKR